MVFLEGFQKKLKKRIKNWLLGNNKPEMRPYIKAALNPNLSDSDFNHEVSSLTKEFNSALSRHQRFSIEDFHSFLGILSDKHGKNTCVDNREGAFFSKISQTDSEQLPPLHWMAIYNACFNYGMFSILPTIRSKAIASAFLAEKQYPGNINTVELAFRAALDTADFDHAERLLNKLKQLQKNELQHIDYTLFFLAQTGQTSDFYNLAHKKLNDQNNDNHFLRLIQNKRVAVVGPAPNGEQTGKEIDSFDFVVRINYRGKDQIKDHQEFGSRIDISYYNGEDSKTILEIKDHAFFDDLMFVVFKSIKHPYQAQMVSKNNARRMFRPTLLFNGSPLQGLSVIYDLLHFKPDFIKLFKTNFFLSEVAYSKGFRESHIDERGNKSSGNGLSRLYSFTQHDLLSQLSFTRNLVKSDVISVDNNCKEVLSLSNENYLKKLGLIYV